MRRNLKDYSDNQLVDEFLVYKNKDAFGEIYERYFDFVCSFVYSRVGNEAWMQEIVSDTFFALLEVLSSYNKKSKLSSFIISIALNKTRSFWYQKGRTKETDFDEGHIILDEDNQDNKNKIDLITKYIQEILSQLPLNYKNILEKRFIENLSIKDTAKELNISEENVRVLQHRALKKALYIGGTYEK